MIIYLGFNVETQCFICGKDRNTPYWCDFCNKEHGEFEEIHRDTLSTLGLNLPENIKVAYLCAECFHNDNIAKHIDEIRKITGWELC